MWISPSWEIYERYTTPMGLNVLHEPSEHFDPMPQIRHTYHQADSRGVGRSACRAEAANVGYVIALISDTPSSADSWLII